MKKTFIANTGIHMVTFPLEIDENQNNRMWFHEWFDNTQGEWKLDLLERVKFTGATDSVYYRKQDLLQKNLRGDIGKTYQYANISGMGITPLATDATLANNSGIFKLTSLSDNANNFESFVNKWLPAPFFLKRTATKFDFGPLNWVRFKLIPKREKNGKRCFDVLLAVDTRTTNQTSQFKETPTSTTVATGAMNFELCKDELKLMDFCSPRPDWAYIDRRLFKLAHPDISEISQLKGQNIKRLSYAASYIYLINLLIEEEARGNFPTIELYQDHNVAIKNIDMIVDIGNSRTTALLVEDNKSFNQVAKLQLTDYTNPIITLNTGESIINRHGEPFDMRLAFRKVSFGNWGIKGSKQFVYPSFIRLGKEANSLIHAASISQNTLQTLSTYSSPKRYLWDSLPNKEEWRFLTLPEEEETPTLTISGLSQYLTSTGEIDETGNGGVGYTFSRKTLMTFSFLEMLVQARTHINGCDYRDARGDINCPRKIKRVIVTCPTAMSKVEREALIHCAEDAVKLLTLFDGKTQSEIEIVPTSNSWYYDEATCAQLVYVYGEVGFKYKGNCSEFFDLYGKADDNNQNSLTLASLDIGAGTTDLMISKYSYTKGNITKLTPDPQFYDSYYFAGDDMLEALIKNIMYLNEISGFRRKMSDLSLESFQQKMKDFVGVDHNGQRIQERILRRDFNLQYSVPLMYYFLELVQKKNSNCIVQYSDVFAECPPNQAILDIFKKRFGFALEDVEWEFNYEEVCEFIAKTFSPLFEKIATIIFAHACDIVLLSGRPASLQPIRDIFLKYYCVSPDRLILLNNYFIGDWYPFDDNTGSIVDAKPIVAIGAAVAHYAAELANVNNFFIDTQLLRKNLKSTINYIEASRQGLPISYFITPDKKRGQIGVTGLPTNLYIRQLGLDSYPSRSLFVLEFNRTFIAKQIIAKGELLGIVYPPATLNNMVDNKIEEYQKQMPYTLTIERDGDDFEKLNILDIIDKDGEDVSVDILDIHIQSLGVDEKHWLDTGEFTF